MEPRFKTSFIPKQSMPKESKAPVERQTRSSHGILPIIAGIVFIVALAGAGAVFVYQNFLVGSIATKAQQLQDARQAFQPALIREIERYANRVSSAQTILDQHLAPSALFELLQATTLVNVRYDSLAMSSSAGIISIEMTGQAANLDAVALQSDILGSNRFISNAIVADLNVNEFGNATFSVNANIDKRFMMYLNRINTSGSDTTVESIERIGDPDAVPSQDSESNSSTENTVTTDGTTSEVTSSEGDTITTGEIPAI